MVFLRRLGSDRDHINSIDFHKKKPYLASGNQRGDVIIWDHKTDQKVKTLKDFKDAITEVKFSDDWLAVGGFKDKIIVYSVNDFEKLREITTRPINTQLIDIYED